MKDESKNQLSVWALYLITAIVQFPLAAWIIQEANSHSQLTQSIAILLLLTIVLLINSPVKEKFVFHFSNECLILLGCSYASVFLNIFFHIPSIALASICLGMGSFLIYVIGKQHRSLVYAVMTGFFVYSNFVLFLPFFDWPLRFIAGEVSLKILSFLGQEVTLNLIGQSNDWKLLIYNNGTPFYVAPECNGYGIITASIITSLCLTIYQRFSLKKSVGLIFIFTVLAFLMNSLRIVFIILLAPIVGMEYYDLMHETIGLIIMISTLVVIWLALTEWLVPKSKSNGEVND